MARDEHRTRYRASASAGPGRSEPERRPNRSARLGIAGNRHADTGLPQRPDRVAGSGIGLRGGGDYPGIFVRAAALSLDQSASISV